MPQRLRSRNPPAKREFTRAGPARSQRLRAGGCGLCNLDAVARLEWLGQLGVVNRRHLVALGLRNELGVSGESNFTARQAAGGESTKF